MQSIKLLLAILLVATSAAAQPTQWLSGGEPYGFVAISSRASALGGGGTVNFGYQYWKISSGGTITLPPCDQPPPNSTADNPQADMVIGDTFLTASSDPIVITCPSGTVAGYQTLTLRNDGQHVWLHWTGTSVQVLASWQNPGIPTLWFQQVGSKTASTVVKTPQPADSATLDVVSGAAFPATNGFVVTIGEEQQQVTAGAGTNTWTVTRGVNDTNAAAHGSGQKVNLTNLFTRLASSVDAITTTLQVNSAAGFPTSGNYAVAVGFELMWVTGGQGTTTWTVQRSRFGTAADTHATTQAVYLIQPTTTINDSGGISAGDTQVTVASAAGFPGAGIGQFVIRIDNEQMLVTAGFGTSTWTIARGTNGTTAASHANGAPIMQIPHLCKTMPRNSALMMLTARNQASVALPVDFGTTPGGTNIASNVNVPGSSLAAVNPPALAGQFFSATDPTPVCLSFRGWQAQLITARAVFAQGATTE